MLDFFSHHYPGISQVNPVSFRDENRDGDNTLVLEEEYLLPDFWAQVESDSTKIYAELSPPDFTEIVDLSASTGRTAPFYLGPPIDLTVKMDLDMPDDWPVKGDEIEISGRFFLQSGVERLREQDQHLLPLSTAPRFRAAPDTPRFISDHHEIWDDLAIIPDRRPQSGKIPVEWVRGGNLPGHHSYRRVCGPSDHLSYDPEPANRPTEGLSPGFWLIILLLGLIVKTIGLVVSVIGTYLNHNTWLAVFTGEGFNAFSGLGTMLTIELLAHSLFLVFSLLLIYQFFMKRSSFPRIDVPLPGIGNRLLLPGLSWFRHRSRGCRQLLDGETFGSEMVSQIIAATIWIPYLLRANDRAAPLSSRSTQLKPQHRLSPTNPFLPNQQRPRFITRLKPPSPQLSGLSGGRPPLF